MIRAENRRGGFAMVVVLLTLLALLVLCTPFLMTVRNADHASAQLADRASVELALDSAGRLARARLGASHPAIDPTPYHDSLAELFVESDFGHPEFLDASDPNGVMFDLDAGDVSGSVDLNSASPQALGNLFGGTAITLGSFGPEDDELGVTSTQGFPEKGFLWIPSTGELLGYTEVTGNSFGGLVRSLGVEQDGDGNPLPCGARPARAVGSNTLIVDQRAFGLALWRSWTADGELRGLDSFEQLRETLEFVMSEQLGETAMETLARTASVYPGVGAQAVWQHPTRVSNALTAGDSCVLRVQDARWFNPGTTVRISDGETTEIGIVRAVGRGDSVVLMDAVTSDYLAFGAICQPLARRPVNINTASEEVLRALVLNLQLRGRQSRITSTEADNLVEVLVQSRPFTSFEDFLRRVILPAGGWAVVPAGSPRVPERFQAGEGLDPADAAAAIQLIDRDDARALYKNALNANDAELGFSTMPFAFVSTQTHGMELRAAVNAASGIERVHAVREQVEHIVPQRDLMYFATRQEDFERLFRLDRDAAGWSTGPLNTTRHDSAYRSTPPTRSRPHLGPRDTMPSDDPLTDQIDHVFASRSDEEDGFASPWVFREWEVGRRAGRMLHFDHERLEPEGRYLPDGRVLQAASDGVVDWLDGSALMRPFAFSLWIKPEDLEDGATFLDVGGSYGDSDRVTLLFEDGDLVLRVLDGASDHPDTAFVEQAEVRYALAQDDAPGIPPDTWAHVSVDVRGTRPDQMVLLVDGRWSSQTPGLTRLTSGIGAADATIPVESTEGFPDRCVLRIGNELIEAVVAGETSFLAQFESEGEGAGFGGRLARQEFIGVDPGVPSALLGEGEGAYPSGTAVELYGYALLLSGNVPPGQAQLAGDVGRFAVGRVIGITEQGVSEGMEEITVQLASGFDYLLGNGLEYLEQAELELAPADPDMEVEQLMSAFDVNGGYAVLMSVSPALRITDGASGQTSEPLTTSPEPGLRIGGVEVVHYSGWTDNFLTIDQRGDSVGLPNLEDAPAHMLGKGAFVIDWNDGLVTGSGVTPDQRLIWQVKVFPISVSAPGAGAWLAGDENNSGENPRLAQITHLGAESHLTEWLRYDYNTGDTLVRDDPGALGDAWFAVQGGVTEDTGDGTSAPGGPGTGGPGGGPGGGDPAPPPAGLSLAGAPSPNEPAPLDGAYWHFRIGDEESDDHPVTRSVASYFQFRGVFGTFDHDHDGGTVVLPVWKTIDSGVDYGRPGRFDAVTLIDSQPSDPGFTGTVHHSHRPRVYTRYHWQENGDTPLEPAEGDAPVAVGQSGILSGFIHVALQDQLSVPISGGSDFAIEGQALYDSRLYTRVHKFPSGELPRTVTTVALGGGHDSTAGVPSATIDEVLFGSTDFVMGSDTHGAQMVLGSYLGESGDTFEVLADSIRVPLGRFGFEDGQFLSSMPSDAGLVRIGDEILCYDSYEESDGIVTIATGGRGMLGTDPQPHVAGEPVSILQHIPVSILSDGVGNEDGAFALADTGDFPGSGLLLVEEELVHYTWIDGAALSMPRISAEPGAMDGDGAGMFRGRFGTTPAAHGAGTPVILFPFRFWDRWADMADAPELHYFGISLSQPNAFWRSVFWDVEEADAGAVLRVLQRSDPAVPWDADPAETPGLTVLQDGLKDGEGLLVGDQSDRIEWRVFVRFEPGAFDPVAGLSHGWKMTPRLKFFGAEYLGPSLVLRRTAR